LLKKNGWDHHNNFWVTDEALKKHKIEFTKVRQRSGDAVITNYLSPHWVHWIDETTQPGEVLFNNFAYNLCPFTSRFFEVLELCNGVEQFDVEALVWRAINFLKGCEDSISRDERIKIHQTIDEALSRSYQRFLQREEDIKKSNRKKQSWARILNHGDPTSTGSPNFIGVREERSDYVERMICNECEQVIFCHFFLDPHSSEDRLCFECGQKDSRIGKDDSVLSVCWEEDLQSLWVVDPTWSHTRNNESLRPSPAGRTRR